MTYNRITAEIGESRRITMRPISYQYDTVQILMLTAADGVELPSYFQVDFCVIGDTDTVTIVGSLTGGAPIPDSLLQQGENLMAYLVLTGSESDVQTRYEITIPVNERPTRSGIEMTSEQQAQVDSLVAALNDGVERAEAASQAVQDMGVEAETLPEGSQATVEKTVDPDTGAVTLGFGIPEGRHGATGATPDIQIGTVTTGAPGSQAAASITGTREEPRLNLTIPQGPQGIQGERGLTGATGPQGDPGVVQSVNGKSAAEITLDAGDIGYDSSETYSSGTVGKTLADHAAALDNKVTAVSGKGLSTNDYTTAEKNKLAGIAAGAKANVQADWNQVDPETDDYIKNKPSNLVLDSSYVHTDNNYSTPEKTKLAGIEDGADKTVTDGTLAVQGKAADAKATGDAIATLNSALTSLETRLKSGEEEDAELHLGFYLDENGDLCQVEEDENNG